ncbi:MAG: peptide chain release factor N(5)-glutamine methyltransferase [Treponema sp.]|nr:peptide chain release factor N(5)-glutamine methyltransferase [Treponema sp.]
MTIRDALKEAGFALKKAGIENSNLDASLLLAKILDTGRAKLIASAAEPLPQEAYMAFNELIARRLKGECAAYILGYREFRGLEFHVNPSVLVPRPDTETLVEAAIAVFNDQAGAGSGIAANEARVLDLCTGSGAVAISLKHEQPQMEIWASDISEQALETAKANAVRLLPENSIHFRLGDLYSALPSENHKLPNGGSSSLVPRFSLIVSNPPYIPCGEIKTLSAEVQNEPRIALDGGKSGLQIIKCIIEGAVQHLIPGGALVLEADPRQMKKIGILLENSGFNSIKLYKDLSNQERVICGICE